MKYKSNSGLKRIRDILLNRAQSKKALKRYISLGMAIACMSSLTVGCSKKMEEPGVIKSGYTILYDTLPEYNVQEGLLVGQMIEFESSQAGIWDKQYVEVNKGLFKKEKEKQFTLSSNNEGIEFTKIDSIVELNDDTNNTVSIRKAENLYTLSENIDKYVQCDFFNKLNFRLEPTTSSESIKVKDLLNDGMLYVFRDDEEVYGNGDHNFKKAIIKKEDENGKLSYISGYVADENDYIRESDCYSCLGIINTDTFARTTPELPEFEESNIVRYINNGERVTVVDDSDEHYYECTLNDNKKEKYYISKKAILYEKDFELNGYFYNPNDNTGKILGYPGTDGVVRAQIFNNENVVIDANSLNNGYYLAWDKTVNRVGYVKGDCLVNKENNITLISEKDEQTEIENEQIEEDNKGIEIINNEDNQTCIYIDISMGYTPEKLETLITSIKEKNIELGGVFFSIGSTGFTDAMSVIICSESDEKYNEYLENPSETIALDKYLNEIRENYPSITFSKGSCPRPDIDTLVNCIDVVVNNDVGVGLYYYCAPTTDREASVEAAYIYAVNKCIESRSEAFKNYNKKFPPIIDIEELGGVVPERAQNPNRAKATEKLVRLLGEGVKNSDNECFCIDGKNVETGYNLTSKEKGIIIYTDVREKSGSYIYNSISENDFCGMISNLEDSGYPIFHWASSQSKNVEIFPSNSSVNSSAFDTLNDLESELNEIKNLVGSEYNNKILFNRASIVQEYLNVMGVSDIGVNFGMDISIGNLRENNNMLTGNKENNNFFTVMEEAINNKNKNEDNLNVENESNSENELNVENKDELNLKNELNVKDEDELVY